MAGTTFERVIGSLFANGTAVANTVTESELCRFKIPADLLADGRKLRVVVWGKYSTTSAPTMTFALRHTTRGGSATSGTQIALSGAITAGSSVTNAVWKVVIDIKVRSNGSSGTLIAVGDATVYSGVAGQAGVVTGSPGVSSMTSGGVTGPATSTVDFTVDTDWVLTLVWGTANASNTAAAVDGDCADRYGAS